MREWERRGERERERAKKPRRQRIWAQASCYRPSGVFNQHTHIHAACCCPLTELLTPPTSGTRTLIDLYWIAQKRRKASTGYCHLFFFLGNCPDVVTVVTLKCLTCKVLIHQPLRCWILLFYGLPRSNSIYSLWMFDAFEMASDMMHNCNCKCK